jgi:hypothetical protein
MRSLMPTQTLLMMTCVILFLWYDLLLIFNFLYNVVMTYDDLCHTVSLFLFFFLFFCVIQ